MDALRLTGEDAHLYKGTLGAEITGDGIDDLDDHNGGGVGSGVGWYRITAIDTGTSGLPTGLAVGDWFWDPGTVIILAAGDKVKPVTLIELCEVSSYSLEPSKTEIDVTTLCDTIKAYRAGKVEITGSFEGIKTVGGTATQIAARNSMKSQFLTLITDDGAGVKATSWSKTAISDDLLWFFAYDYLTSVSAEIEEVSILPIRLLSMSMGATIDDKQTMNGSFRVDGSEKPQTHQRTIA